MTVGPDPDRVVAETRAWVRRVVIGLGLCPFAKAPEARARVRYVVCPTGDDDALVSLLADELKHLRGTPDAEVETTLVVHPHGLADFLEFNDFVDVAEAVVSALDLDGEVQIVPFHPLFQFAGTDADDLGNATNRSPWPTLQLLREDSVDRAVAAFPDADRLYETNIATMNALGRPGWAALQAACRADASGTPTG